MEMSLSKKNLGSFSNFKSVSLWLNYGISFSYHNIYFNIKFVIEIKVNYI